MNNNKNTSLVNGFKTGLLLAVISTAILIILLITYIEYNEFVDESAKLESEFLSTKKSLIKQEVNRVTDYIARARLATQKKIKIRIKNRVYEAHSIATNIYNKFNGKLADKSIKKLIIETLRSMRFFNGDGYYYIHTLNGDLQLQPLKPEREGTNRLNFKNANNQYIVKDLLAIVKNSDEGYLSYTFPSFKVKNKEREKVAFVKLFKPYNWSIGTGDYIENIEKDIQKELLEHIGQIKFGNNSYIFVVDYDGNILMNASQRNLIGTNMSKLLDPNGTNVFLEERKAVENPEGDFIYYVWNKPSSSSPSPKMTFMKGVKDWQWMVGTGLYIDDVEKIIQLEKDKLKSEVLTQTSYIFVLVLLSSILIFYIANRFNLYFSSEIGQLLSFFQKTSGNSERINTDLLRFTELKELADQANKMLDNKNQTDLSLRYNEKLLKEAQRITHFGSWELDIKNNVLHWSDEVYRIFEIDPGIKPSYEMFLSYVHPDDKHLVDNAYHLAVKNKTPYDIEHRIALENDKVKYVREHAETYYDDDGNPISSSGTVQDITELKEKEDQLRRTQKMDALGKLTGGIAHDYNNMMGIVLGYSELLLSHVAGKEKAIDYVVQIRIAGERAKSLTDKLMSFSRYKASETKVIDINKQINQEQNLLEKTLTSRINLTLNLQDDLWLTKIDPGDFSDAIINMTINASHAIKRNGTMDISTKNIEVSGYETNSLELKPGDYVSITISDSGIGMDENTIAKIFDPFFSTKGDLGTGLGLSQVYGFTRRSNGSVKVISNIGQGTEFTLYFPRYKDETQQKEDNDIIEDIPTKQGHEVILVVDDEEPLCDVACTLLSDEGYKVLKALSAQQALDILESEHVDLVFSDIVMPQMTGFELAEIISQKYPEIVTQLTSGYNDAKKLNIDTSELNILAKPYSRSDLLNHIHDALNTESI